MAEGPQLVIGLVGAVGTDLNRLTEMFSQALAVVRYRSVPVRLSSLLATQYGLKIEDLPEDERLDLLMTAGDNLRAGAGREDAMAILGMAGIQKNRETEEPGRLAHIIRSLKHPEELKTLRDVYGQAFVAVAVYMPRTRRIRALAERISSSSGRFKADQFLPRAEDLVDRDEEEEGVPHGQNVRNVFPECDAFLDATDDDHLERQIKRFIEILFKHPHRTPTREEYAFFHAKAAAMRSADLSRQVGAVITNSKGDILTSGCNDVPKVGGGVVWEGDAEGWNQDFRDQKIGHDSTVRMKHEIIGEIIDKFRGAKWLCSEVGEAETEALVERALYGKNPPLKGTRAASILEFGRIVHAEMAAITAAARLGISVQDATLYCTTFPCHMCARHIVSAGISEVVYVEPYPKSMTGDLYEGSIQVDHEGDGGKVVHFRPFVGVAPRRFIDFFQMPKRKNERGKSLAWDPTSALPRVKLYATYKDIEKTHIQMISGFPVALTSPLTANLLEERRDGGSQLAESSGREGCS